VVVVYSLPLCADIILQLYHYTVCNQHQIPNLNLTHNIEMVIDDKEKNDEVLKHQIFMYNIIYNFYSHNMFIIIICIILFIIYS